ncbi:hypothetical protein BKI52_10085 [marine bacterium AO1-C]|nr:hypothetical protein BKI52_10085 [marine bacterium AO1-C]
MFPKQNFKLKESTKPITEPITKFGGQPVWINTPQWPIDPYPTEQVKMLFIGQIALNPAVFSGSEGMMAYIFFAEEGEPLIEEQLVTVIQTKNNPFVNKLFYVEMDEVFPAKIEFLEELQGPVIYDKKGLNKEYSVALGEVQQEKKLPVGTKLDYERDYTPRLRFKDAKIGGNKIGGQPVYFNIDYPIPYNPEDWYLLLQLVPVWGEYFYFPFFIGVYPVTIIQIFISKDFKNTVSSLPGI